MQFFTLETNRPTDIRRVASVAMTAVFIGVVLILFGAPLIVKYQYATLHKGDIVAVEGVGPGELVTVEKIQGPEALVRTSNGAVVAVDTAALREL